MPSYSRDRHVTSPFLESPPMTPWRSKAADLHRRSSLLKRVAFLAVFLAFALPIWMLTSHSQEVADEAIERPLSPPAAVHEQWSPAAHRHPATKPQVANGAVEVPTVHDDSGLVKETLHVEEPRTQPVTFSLIMWSRDSASEGVILVKSILMYASSPVHIHIICDEAAQTYLEERLALVTRPKYDFLVRFYRPSYQDMLDRVEREGSLATIHSAGVVGLMKLFIHEILPDTVKKSIFVDTDAFFISDPLLLWQQFDKFAPETAISMPSHPDQQSDIWLNANKICSCVMLLDLEKLRVIRLMDSSVYRAADDGLSAFSPPAFEALFGPPDTETGKYKDVWLGDQSYWWAIISHRPDVYMHLSYDWEISSCLVDMYITGLGDPDATEAEQIKTQTDRVKYTPHANTAVIPRLLHFNCMPVDNYYDWDGWNDPEDSLNKRWGTAVRYHTGYKWYWLNQAPNNDTTLTIETVEHVNFADLQYAQKISH